MSQSPFNPQGDPNHPGVTGQPYAGHHHKRDDEQSPKGDMPLSEQDPTGTGTFPPEQQGTENQAQPRGLSAHTQTGHTSGDPLLNPQGRQEDTLSGNKDDSAQNMSEVDKGEAVDPFEENEEEPDDSKNV